MMEEEDEFGDLYTDVLSTFPSSTSSALTVSGAAVTHTIDLNLESEVTDDVLNSTRSSQMNSKLGEKDSRNLEQEQEQEREPNSGGIRVLQTVDLNQLEVKEEEKEDKGVAAASDDWEESESDSDDDLQIVLNDAHHGPMGMEANGIIIGSDDEDEDGEPLVIVADDDAAGGLLQPAEDQDWGDDSADLKDSTDPSKPNPALSTAPKLPYNTYAYHPFHSQFKYVRPGAAPLPGGPPVGSGGASSQVRPAVSLNTVAVRGRGDWRPLGMKGPPLQKGFHLGFWASNVAGRGLDFTLPSHKTIFDVDIDSFEEKPWKYPDVDLSDFFNFGLNEEGWKEYCKQLEQLRLASTMQSKIRVYESGRVDQEYDPDMPPELALATGIQDSSAEIVDTANVDVGLGDQAKGSARLRPLLPTGRAIQVETGGGERLPSVDTRPPRVRDSDAVIEIVLQDSFDDESVGNEAEDHPDNDSAREDDQVDVVDEDGPHYFGGNEAEDHPGGYKAVTEDGSQKRSGIIDSHADIGKGGDESSPPRAPSDQHLGSTGHASSGNADSPYGERWIKEKTRSPHMSSGESASDYQRESSLEGKLNPEVSSATPIEEEILAKEEDTEEIQADVESGKGKEANVVASSNTSKDKHSLRSVKQQKLISEVELLLDKEVDGGDFKASRSSDNSKATASSRDRQKWSEGVDEEVVQIGRSPYVANPKRSLGEGRHDLRRKDRDGKIEMERNYEREEYYSHRDWDPHVNSKSESSDCRKEYTEVGWARRDEDSHGRRIRAEDNRKQEHVDDMVSRHRAMVREVDRSDKDEYLYSRKVTDNGSWRGYHDKDVVGLRYREKDDVSKSRHEVFDDHHSKRRKGDEHARRDHVEKEEILLSHRDSSITRQKRERDVLLSHKKREDQPRMRDNMDDWYRPKHSYEEVLSRREREDGRAHIRSTRNIEEKAWVGHDKDTGRHSEQLRRRERVEEEASWKHRGGGDVYARGNQFANEGKRTRQERSSSRNNCAADASDVRRLHEKKHKENIKKTKESEGHSTFGQYKRYQGDKRIANEMAGAKGISEQATAEHDTSFTKEGREDASSDDELHNSKRGRSKLERWTSHKDRDYDVYSKSSTLKIKEMNEDKNAGSGVPDESAKNEAGDRNQVLAKGEEGGVSEGKDVDERSDGRHLDTVEKLKRRSERFKLPLTSEKDPMAIKKKESEPLPSLQNDGTANSEVKLERPPRKRRWINS